MKNFTILSSLLFLSIHFIVTQAKVRRKYADTFERSLQNKIALIRRDLLPNKMKLVNRQRQKRDVINDNNKESDEFQAQIKFLEKWNPSMSNNESSASRLFRGNVLDAILEQLNGDQRFINSYVLGLKNTSGGILVQIGFHFRKSEQNPISHVKFIVSQGHLSSLKVDKNYFKVLGSNDQIQAPSHNNQLVSQTKTQSLHNPQQLPPAQGQLTTPAQNLVQYPSQNLPQTQSNNQPQTMTQTHVQTQEQPPTQTNTQSDNQIENENHPQPQQLYGTLGSQPANIQSEANPSAAVAASSQLNVQDNSQVPIVRNDLSIALRNHLQTSPSSLPNHVKKEEIIFIKMNQNWYPFLSNHNSLEYKIVTANLEKGLKAVTAGDNSIVGIKVKNLTKDEQGLTKVQLSVKFLEKNGDPADKLKSIVKTGDIAGISVDSNFFEEDGKAASQNQFGSNEGFPKSCDEVRSMSIGTKDGEYVIEARSGCHLNIICQNMNEQHAKEYLGGPQQKYWLYWPYAALVKISDHDKKNIPEETCLENTADGKAFLSRASAAKQGNPSIPWKDNVKKILKS